MGNPYTIAVPQVNYAQDAQARANAYYLTQEAHAKQMEMAKQQAEIDSQKTLGRAILLASQGGSSSGGGSSPVSKTYDAADASSAPTDTSTEVNGDALGKPAAAGGGGNSLGGAAADSGATAPATAPMSSGGSGKPNPDFIGKTVQNAVAMGVMPQHIMAWQKQQLDAAKDLMSVAKDAREEHLKQTDELNGTLNAVLSLPPEKQEDGWQNAIKSAVAKGDLTQEDLQSGKVPLQFPGVDAVQHLVAGSQLYSAQVKQSLEMSKAEDEKTTAGARQTQANVAQTRLNAELPGIKAASDQKQQSFYTTNLAAAAKNGPAAYQAALDEVPSKIAKNFERAFPDPAQATPAAIMALGLSPDQAVTTGETKDYHGAELGIRGQELANQNIRTGIEREKSYREEKIYNQTYGEGANPALVGVEPKLRTQAASAAIKATTSYLKGQEMADQFETVLGLAQGGNKAAGANLPLVGVEAVNAIAGIKRINSAEIHQYGTAGDLYDKVIGEIKGWTEGVPLSKGVMEDIGKLHSALRANSTKSAQDQLDSINQTYRSNFQLPKVSKGSSDVQGGTPVKGQKVAGTVYSWTDKSGTHSVRFKGGDESNQNNYESVKQ